MYKRQINSPINKIDIDGNFPLPVITGIIGAGASFLGSVVGQLGSSGNVNWGDAFIAGGVGFVAGATAPVTLTGTLMNGAISNMVQYGLTQLSHGCSISMKAMFANGLIGAVSGGIGGPFKPQRYMKTIVNIHPKFYSITMKPYGKGSITISNMLRNLVGAIYSNLTF